MIFKVILWYALLKGVWKGLHKPPPMTVRGFNEILTQYYIKPITEQLNLRTSFTERYESEFSGQDS